MADYKFTSSVKATTNDLSMSVVGTGLTSTAAIQTAKQTGYVSSTGNSRVTTVIASNGNASGKIVSDGKTVLNTDTIKTTTSYSSYGRTYTVVNDPTIAAYSTYGHTAYIGSKTTYYSSTAHYYETAVVNDAAREKEVLEGWYIDSAFFIPVRTYRLKDLTTEAAQEEDTYIEDPYQAGSYIKKSVRRNLVNGSNNILAVNANTAITKPNLTGSYLFDDVIQKFKSTNRFRNDALIQLRGETIEDTNFLGERRKALLSSLTRLLKSSTFSLYDLKTELLQSTDGMIRIYNFAKAAVELASQEARNNLNQVYFSRFLCDPKDYSYKIILQEIPYTIKEVEPEVEEDSTISTQKLRLGTISGARMRTVIEKMATAKVFPSEISFETAYKDNVALSILREKTANEDNFSKNPNYHLRDKSRAVLDNRNLSYDPTNDHLRILTVDALKKFAKTKQEIYLKSDFKEDIIESTVQDISIKETSDPGMGYNKYVYNYLLLDPITSESMDNNDMSVYSIQSIIDLLITPGEGTIMEVLNG